MKEHRRTQPERSAATKNALIGAARRLWGARGYADVGTPEIAEAAGVTRGAMYHQFADKAALFLAVIEAVEQQVMEQLAQVVAAAAPTSAAQAIHVAADAWIQAAVEPEIRQLLLLDAPNVLGWEQFREVAQRYGLGMTERLLQSAIDAGELKPRPVRPLALMLLGALDEGAMYVANADDPGRAASETRAVVDDLIDALLTQAATRPRTATRRS
jgi:AcrR family transcriptional regulator